MQVIAACNRQFLTLEMQKVSTFTVMEIDEFEAGMLDAVLEAFGDADQLGRQQILELFGDDEPLATAVVDLLIATGMATPAGQITTDGLPELIIRSLQASAFLANGGFTAQVHLDKVNAAKNTEPVPENPESSTPPQNTDATQSSPDDETNTQLVEESDPPITKPKREVIFEIEIARGDDDYNEDAPQTEQWATAIDSLTETEPVQQESPEDAEVFIHIEATVTDDEPKAEPDKIEEEPTLIEEETQTPPFEEDVLFKVENTPDTVSTIDNYEDDQSGENTSSFKGDFDAFDEPEPVAPEYNTPEHNAAPPPHAIENKPLHSVPSVTQSPAVDAELEELRNELFKLQREQILNENQLREKEVTIQSLQEHNKQLAQLRNFIWLLLAVIIFFVGWILWH